MFLYSCPIKPSDHVKDNIIKGNHIKENPVILRIINGPLKKHELEDLSNALRHCFLQIKAISI